MRLSPVSALAAAMLIVVLSGCETKVKEITAVCRPGDAVTAPVRWEYPAKVGPSVIERIPLALDITLHYTGTGTRAVPPITTYFYRSNGAALRVASSATATLPPKGSFTYHVDTGGYAGALLATGRGAPEELAFFVVVDGSYFGGPLSPASCGRWPDGHIDLGKASKLPDLKDKHPLNMAQSDWLLVMPTPPAVARIEGPETSTFAFFPAPIKLTEAKNETSVPDDPAKQEAQVGITAATPLFPLTRPPAPQKGRS